MKIRVRTFDSAGALEVFLNSIPEGNIIGVTESSAMMGYALQYHYTLIYRGKY